MTSRRSARNATLQNPNVSDENQDAQSDASLVEPVGVAAPTHRKRKAEEDSDGTKEHVEAFNSKRPKLKKLEKGSLQQVAEMPLDVLFEVSHHIQMARPGGQLKSVADLQQVQSD